MTIETTTNRINQTSDGVSVGPFSFDFLVLDETHLYVYLNGDESNPLTGYTVSGIGNPAGGTITFTSPPPAGTLTIIRKVPRKQTYDYVLRGKFPSETHERLADLAVMMIQEVEDKVARSIQLPITTNTGDLALPEPEALRFMRWNADQTALENIDIALQGALAVSDFAKTLIDDQDATAALATLGLSVSDYIKTLLDDSDYTTALNTLKAAIGEGTVTSGADLDTITKSGVYTLGFGHINAPTGVDLGQLLVLHGSGVTITQIVTDFASGVIYWRSGSPPDVGGSDPWGAWQEIFHSGSDPFAARLLHVQDQKPSGTTGGSSVAGVNVRDLNTVLTNEISGASLASNQITLPAGTYYIEASAPMYASNRAMLKLYNVTTGTYILHGMSVYCTNTGNDHEVTKCDGRITLATTSTLELHVISQAGVTTYGLGIDTSPAGTIDHNTYADVRIWKVA